MSFLYRKNTHTSSNGKVLKKFEILNIVFLKNLLCTSQCIIRVRLRLFIHFLSIPQT